ncbi:MAG: patatin-like phospholipase family protein, partial [Tardiphaga sp.]
MRSATSATGQAAYPVNFKAFVQAEVDQINARRARVAGTEPVTPVQVEKTGPGAPLLEVVGLTMSGGGIRSASFCLGVTQALHGEKVFDHIDYLSTVSGGGYLGASISTTMAATGGEFVFGEEIRTTGQKALSDLKDTAAVAHIRDYSNYLIPRGLSSLSTALAIIVRGLVANAALVLPVVLFFAAITVFANPSRSSLLQPDIFGVRLPFLPASHFGVTLLLLGVTFIAFLLWAIRRSEAGIVSEFCTPAPVRAAWWLGAVAGVAMFEAQPFVIDGMFDLYDTMATDGRQNS